MMERDLQNHLIELSKTVQNMPNMKVSTILEESVKYLQKIYSNLAEDVADEVNLNKKVVDELREKVVTKYSTPEGLVVKMTAMEKVVSECNALAAGVPDRERRMKDRLAGLLLHLDREMISTRRMVDNGGDQDV